MQTKAGSLSKLPPPGSRLGMGKKPLPADMIGRSFRLGKLGFSLTTSYLGYQMQNLVLGETDRKERRLDLERRTSRRVQEELAALKGPAMKLGQMLSMQTHALSSEAIEELSRLQMRAPSMHPTLARARFTSSLGKSPDKIFDSFEDEPFAAASLGQVHRATLPDGTQVAVKIQYPAIRTAIENDFKLLRSATLPGRLIGHDPLAILNEVQRGFLEETDYLQEAKNLETFSKALANLPYLTIPKVYREWTTDRVLTMSFVPGFSVREFLRGNPGQSVCDLIGSRLLELYVIQLHRLRMLHADHHPGNYLFQKDGKIGLVDFGCVKRITFDASELLRCCVNRTWREGEAASRHVLNLIFGPKIPYSRARKMIGPLEEMASILFPEGKHAELPVDFGKPKLLETLGQALKTAVRDKVTNPEFAFVSRAEMGLYSLLHQLRANVSPRQAWLPILEGGFTGR